MKRPEDFKILVGCEESQAVCIEFRKLGFEAYSCDLLPCSGGHPEWHLQQDITEILKQQWDIMIAFPPCTHLAVSGAAWFYEKIKDGRQQCGKDFFMKMVNAQIDKICIENPIGIMSKQYRKPDQIIQPYFFGDGYSKSTCLWLKNLPLLFHSKEKDLFCDNVTHVDSGEWFYWTDKKTGKLKRQPKWFYDAFLKAKTKEERSTMRSKTFPGIAKAMAEQWGNYLLKSIL
jgi:hypothetical protein